MSGKIEEEKASVNNDQLYLQRLDQFVSEHPDGSYKPFLEISGCIKKDIKHHHTIIFELN